MYLSCELMFKNANSCWHFNINEHDIVCSVEMSIKKCYNLKVYLHFNIKMCFNIQAEMCYAFIRYYPFIPGLDQCIQVGYKDVNCLRTWS